MAPVVPQPAKRWALTIFRGCLTLAVMLFSTSHLPTSRRSSLLARRRSGPIAARLRDNLVPKVDVSMVFDRLELPDESDGAAVLTALARPEPENFARKRQLGSPPRCAGDSTCKGNSAYKQ